MSVLTREDFFTRLNDFVGDNSSDDAISFVEDMTDTYNDIETRANGDGTDWEQRYRENDEAWRKKYRSRFFSGTAPYPREDEIHEEKREITYEDLFTEKGDK